MRVPSHNQYAGEESSPMIDTIQRYVCSTKSGHRFMGSDEERRTTPTPTRKLDRAQAQYENQQTGSDCTTIINEIEIQY